MKSETKIVAEPEKQELFIIREFEASRELVFAAFTQPDLLSQWFLPSEQNMGIDFMDYQTGGSYRFLYPGPNGSKVGIFGIVHEILAPVRISKTFEYEGLPEKGLLAIQKTVFETIHEDRTKVTIHFICESVAYRDGLVNSGMEAHSSQCHLSLDQLLVKMKTK
jgi:uncharacterized protein YndB with AHSA1/START domain